MSPLHTHTLLIDGWWEREREILDTYALLFIWYLCFAIYMSYNYHLYIHFIELYQQYIGWTSVLNKGKSVHLFFVLWNLFMEEKCRMLKWKWIASLLVRRIGDRLKKGNFFQAAMQQDIFLGHMRHMRNWDRKLELKKALVTVVAYIKETLS